MYVPSAFGLLPMKKFGPNCEGREIETAADGVVVPHRHGQQHDREADDERARRVASRDVNVLVQLKAGHDG